MVYPDDVEEKLGFDQLRLRLATYCLSGLGLNELEKIRFRSDFQGVRTLLLQTDEFKQILDRAEDFPQDHFFDPGLLLKTIVIEESFIEADEMLKIAQSLQTVFSCMAFLIKSEEIYPELFRLKADVQLPKTIPQQITSKIDDTGTVRDNASPELARIRKQLRDEQGRVRKLTEHVYRNAVQQGWVPEGASPTIRDGRVVIPVSAEHKRKLRGFIIDESATGQTVYLEPAEVLEANNEIRDLEHGARREIVKILKELTTLLRKNLPEIENAYAFLGQCEIIRARAKLAVEMAASLPTLKETPDLNWRSARHPLLYLTLKGKRPVVPLTIDLTAKDRLLLVSGPNAGGKSVCLKTVGLIQYMIQCGLLVPMHDKSSTGIFQNIFLDIGDQQSIENDLSTYSSHLKNLNYFIRHATDSTLVLMDELGAGTDPNFGGGIAQAVLDTLVHRKVWGVVTTHYYNLKAYAGHSEGIRNGAMLFDTRKLEPLFQLEIGKPGSSFALEIARKIGLPAETIRSAENIIGKELTGLESLLKTVSEDKLAVARKETELAAKEKNLTTMRAQYEKLSSELEQRKTEIIEKAKSEASYLLKETNREIEKTIRHIQENKAEKKETRKVRQNLQELTEKIQPEKKALIQPLLTGEIKKGDSVRLIGQEVSGKVLSLHGNSALVQFGDLRSQVKIIQLVRSDLAITDTTPRTRSAGFDLHRRQSEFSPVLDVRGKRAEEVLPLLEQFLDNGILFSQGQLKILHGKGEGVLRKIIREKLTATKGVASFADEAVEFGGAGITVVVLK
jgi:DNA mismatch repair protein MutS2